MLEPRIDKQEMSPTENFIKKGFKNQEDIINKRVKELDDIIVQETGQPQARAKTGKMPKSNQ
jgi:hypothetical protein